MTYTGYWAYKIWRIFMLNLSEFLCNRFDSKCDPVWQKGTYSQSKFQGLKFYNFLCRHDNYLKLLPLMWKLMESLMKVTEPYRELEIHIVKWTHVFSGYKSLFVRLGHKYDCINNQPSGYWIIDTVAYVQFQPQYIPEMIVLQSTTLYSSSLC